MVKEIQPFEQTVYFVFDHGTGTGSCNNVAPVTNLCLGRATTRSHSSQWSKKKVAVETLISLRLGFRRNFLSVLHPNLVSRPIKAKGYSGNFKFDPPVHSDGYLGTWTSRYSVLDISVLIWTSRYSELDSSGLGWDNIPYWPQLFGTYLLSIFLY